MPADKKRR